MVSASRHTTSHRQKPKHIRHLLRNMVRSITHHPRNKTMIWAIAIYNLILGGVIAGIALTDLYSNQSQHHKLFSRNTGLITLAWSTTHIISGWILYYQA